MGNLVYLSIECSVQVETVRVENTEEVPADNHYLKVMSVRNKKKLKLIHLLFTEVSLEMVSVESSYQETLLEQRKQGETWTGCGLDQQKQALQRNESK